MDFIYLIIFIFIVLGVGDLVVGVSNDAVNFLNSAIGSRVASRRLIYSIAGLGLIIGSMFSGGMMEVAREGIFYPENMHLNELVILFLAVMLTDILLIDVFNTYGFPTSTTVSIIFELLGGALAIGLIVSNTDGSTGLHFNDLINTSNVFFILGGIIFSIIFAFIGGSLVQFIARFIFTFNYTNKFKVLFSIAGALAITSLVFLIVKKEQLFADFIYGGIEYIINTQLTTVLLIVFATSFIVFLLLSYLFNINIPKVVVFFGTFSLAMSFASNDLVNFIGVPLAGIEGLMAFKNSGAIDQSQFVMNIWDSGYLTHSLLGTHTYSIVYILSGVVMMVTIFISRKARTVIETEVYLGRQDAGYESFEPSFIAKVIVRAYFSLYKQVKAIVPKKLLYFISKRFEHSDGELTNSDHKIIYFDTIRASVNLVVACVFIAFGTYLRFPLSTTFVVFMVAMGTSLSDQAWGRESAVYRISGVLSVLGGWFLTAIAAFVGAFILVLVLWWGKMFALALLLVLVMFVLYRSTAYHKRLRTERKELKKVAKKEMKESINKLTDLGGERIRKYILETSKMYMLIIQGFVDENTRQLKEASEKIVYLEKFSEETKLELFNNFSQLSDEHFEAGHYLIQAMDYISELVSVLRHMSNPILIHLDNQHKGLSVKQKEDILWLLEEVSGFFNFIVHIEKERRFNSIDEILQRKALVISLIDELRKKQIRRIKDGSGHTRSGILLLECYAETKNLTLYTVNLLKAHRDFYYAKIS